MAGRILFTLLAGILLFSPEPTYAIPQFTLLTGNRCINCHETNQGSGKRSDLGQYAMDGVSLIDPKSVGLAGLYEALSSDGGGPVSWGFDFRAQTVRSHVSPQADRRYFPMQAALYSSVAAADWLTLEGAANFGPKKFDGQRRWSATAIIQPSFNLPSLRVGYFQPSTGIRYDDHTMLVRSTGVSSGSQSLVAPNYAEVGAEVTYYKYRWMSLTAGVFGAQSLSENRVDDLSGQPISLIEDEDRPSVLGRVVFWPRGRQGSLNSYFGGSYLLNDNFKMLSAFAGIGLQDRISLMGEYVRSDKDDLREGRNVSVDLCIQFLDSLLGFVRGEQAITRSFRTNGLTEVTTKHLVAGVQLFVLPGVEIRPEYRLLDSEVFRSGRYAVQLHFFR